MKKYNCIDQSQIFESYPQFEDALYMLSEEEDIDETYFDTSSLDTYISEISEGIEEDRKMGYSDDDLINAFKLIESLKALKDWMISENVDRVIWD